MDNLGNITGYSSHNHNLISNNNINNNENNSSNKSKNTILTNNNLGKFNI